MEERHSCQSTSKTVSTFPRFQAIGFVITLVLSILVSLSGTSLSSSKAWLLLFGLLSLSIYFALWGLALYNNFVTFGRGASTEKLRKYEATYSTKDRSGIANANAVQSTTEYYDMVTDWYENCWGQSFQLGSAQGFLGESFSERCRRHDYWFANRAGITKGQLWLDIGCGIGGPLRNIVRFTEAKVIGINCNQYQIDRARLHLSAEGLNDYGSFVYCDMGKVAEKFDKESVDGIYALEAVCHTADKVSCYKGFYPLLKPGATFAFVEWVLTDKYDPSNKVHQECKHAIEILGGVPHLETNKQVVSKVKEAGFEILYEEDMSLQIQLFPDPWHDKFEPGFSPFKWPISKTGILMLQYMLCVSEFLKIVPAGSAKAHRTITSGIDGTGLGGKLGIFTPHYFVKARKPL